MKRRNLATDRFKFSSTENDGELRTAPRHHDRQFMTAEFKHIGRRIVAMKCQKFDIQRLFAFTPLLLLSKETVGDVAERAMRAPDARSEPIAKFT